MTSPSSMTELRKMHIDDLQREAYSKRMIIAKIGIGIAMRQEKDTALLRREKKELARLLTILREKSVLGSRTNASASTP